MSTLKVNTIRHTGASSDAITLASDGTCTAKITNNLSNRNLIINGAMNVAQRGTSSTTGNSFVADRYKNSFNGTDESPTYAQHALTSSDTGPWEKGFRNSLHITNGNQTGGASANDNVSIVYKLEAQEMANSGWDYTSASSYITLSFWVKASVAQDYQMWFYTSDGTSQGYAFTYALSANTWTKITKKIPGNSNIQFDNDAAQGLEMVWQVYLGTDSTASSGGAETWGAWSGTTTRKDMTSTWYTTNDATFEITGVQLEVGDVATDFEHRSFGDELARCQRYYQKSYDYGTAVGTATSTGAVMKSLSVTQTYASAGSVKFPVQMRAIPTMTVYSTQSGTSGQLAADSTDGAGTTFGHSETGATFFRNNSNSGTAVNVYLRAQYTAEAEL